MPHYADGTIATIGDVIKGKGYNIRDEFGELAEITGILLNIHQGSEVCNIEIAVIKMKLVDPNYDTEIFERKVPIIYTDEQPKAVITEIEYGQADHFLKCVPPVIFKAPVCDAPRREVVPPRGFTPGDMKSA